MIRAEMKILSAALVLLSLYLLLGFDEGALEFNTPDFQLRLLKSSQTVAALAPKNTTPGFDFTPADRLSQRAANRYHHLGDLILRTRTGPPHLFTLRGSDGSARCAT